MALVMDRPGPTGWVHLISDRPAPAGEIELRHIRTLLGIRRPLHRAGSYAEHLDIRGDEIRRAKAAGVAVVSRRGLALILREKRRTARGEAEYALPAPTTSEA